MGAWPSSQFLSAARKTSIAMARSKSKKAKLDSVTSVPEAAQIGQTSGENPVETARPGTRTESSVASREFPLFNAMLLISLICVTLATGLLFFALREYGTGFYQWRVSEF